jgi:uncharacterized membrane protein
MNGEDRRRLDRERKFHHEEGVSRIVDFSNGVMGFAITLLVLDIKVPEKSSLASVLPRELLALWPQYLAYMVSFFVIGENWIIFNRIYRHIVRVDEPLYWFNLLFLFFIVFLPFPTSLISVYPGNKLSALMYGGTIVCVVFARTLIWWYATRNHRLVHETLEPAFIRRTLLYAVTMLAGFIVACVIAFFSPVEAIHIWILLALFSLVSRLILYSSRRREEPAP